MPFTAQDKKDIKNGDRTAMDYELQESNKDEEPGWKGVLARLGDSIATKVSKLFIGGGDYGVFVQQINTSYSASQVAMYEARLIPGPITHPISKEHLPAQKTVFDDILTAIGGNVPPVPPS